MQEYNYACKDCRKHTQGKDINKNYEQKYASESLFLNIRVRVRQTQWLL